MKCDVCGTKIPLGSNECPNCGYKMKKEHVQSFDASGSHHEHIRSQSMHSFHETKLNDIKVNARRNVHPQRVKGTGFSVLKIIFIIVFVLILIGGIAVPIFISKISDWSIQSEEPSFSGMTFQDIIDSGYDDLTLTVAINEKENVETFMRDKLMLENIDTYEYCNEYNDRLYATFSVEGNDDLAYYKISCSISEDGFISGYDMNLSCSGEKSIRLMDKVPFQKDKVDAIGDYIQIGNAYDLMDSNRINMKLDEDSDDRYVYSNNGTPYIYMSESQYVDNYHFYCSLSN